ncbi:hypothetical protein ACFQI7_00105 [Paenibacillus allorhizosphaerae]|uniref:hypothetical protein n=1 Tax=Paenibacillus allorhizosphaerae TaxID=2849866 RepID=UPI001C4055A4|nr:hypothetical protein [Paenibacillus allorhizosphaerae]
MTNKEPDMFRREALDCLLPATTQFTGLRPVPAWLTFAFWFLLSSSILGGLAGRQFVSVLIEGLFGTSGGGANG